MGDYHVLEHMRTFHVCMKAFIAFVLNAGISKHLPSKVGCTHKGRFTRVQTLTQTDVGAVCLEQAGTETLEDCCALGKLPRFAGLSFIYNLTGPGERAVYFPGRGHVGIGGAEEEE